MEYTLSKCSVVNYCVSELQCGVGWRIVVRCGAVRGKGEYCGGYELLAGQERNLLHR